MLGLKKVLVLLLAAAPILEVAAQSEAGGSSDSTGTGAQGTGSTDSSNGASDSGSSDFGIMTDIPIGNSTQQLVAAPSQGSGATAPPLGSWNSIWYERFNQETSLSSWSLDVGVGYPDGASYWGTNEVETMSNMYTLNPSYGLGLYTYKDSSGKWWSTRIETVRTDIVAPPGGASYVSAYIFLPQYNSGTAQGMWPAFWMMGEEQKANRSAWPQCGEIDIMEQVNDDGNWHFGVHCDVSPGGACNENNGISSAVTYTQGQWNRFGVLIDLNTPPGRWDMEEIVWVVNGKPVWSISGSQFYPNHYAAWQSLAQNPMFVILNVAVGGDWPKAPTSNTVSGYEMWVWDVAFYTLSPTTSGVQYNSPSSSQTTRRSTGETSGGSTGQSGGSSSTLSGRGERNRLKKRLDLPNIDKTMPNAPPPSMPLDIMKRGAKHMKKH